MYIILLKILIFILGCLVLLFCIGLASLLCLSVIIDLKKELKGVNKND